MRRLLFIKSESVQSSFEEGRQLLVDLGVDVDTIPAISFEFKNLDKFHDCLERSQDYAGLIITSSRTVEAIKKAGEGVLSEWKSLRNYCVGQTTLKKIETDLGSGWTVKGGAATGNAELLSEMILGDLINHPTEKPFLFPCSNLALGTLVTRLQSVGHGIETVEVYETVKHHELDSRVQGIPFDAVEFILFFSPSTVQYFLDSLRKSNLEERFNKSPVKLIAIGPSTSQEMIKQGLSVHASCSRPNIESLIEIIKS